MPECTRGTVVEVSAGPHDRKDAFVSFCCAGACGDDADHTVNEIDAGGNVGEK